MANARSSDCTIDTDLLEFHCTARFRIVEHAHMADDTLDLKTLTDDELVAQMHDDLYDGLADEIAEGTQILLDREWAAEKVLNDALVEGMRIVGIDFRDGILFVPEVLLAANAMKGGMFILKPLLAETGAPRVGKMGVACVYSREPVHLPQQGEGEACDVVDGSLNCHGYGSSVTVTATFGLCAAAELQRLHLARTASR